MKRSRLFKLKKFKKASVLIKLLVFIGILSILLAILITAINPAKQFAEANNAKRNSDVIKILNAIHQYAADNQALYPPDMPKPGSDAENISESGANICASLVTKYLVGLPSDPTSENGGVNINCGAGYDSGYTVSVSSADGRIMVAAPNTQSPLTNKISVTR